MGAVGIEPAQLTITSSAAQCINDLTETDAKPGSATFQGKFGYAITVATSGPLHFGPANVANSGSHRGALLPAGVYTWSDLSDDNKIYAIAPEGQSVTVERFPVGY